MVVDAARSTKRKSLLYISVQDPHVPLTGTNVRGEAFVEYLAQHFNVDLVYLEGAGHPPIQKFSQQFSSKLTQVRLKTGVRFNKFNYFVFSKQLYSYAKKLLSEHQYDYIVCDYGLSAIYGLLLSKKFNIPFIYLSHNIEYLQYLGKAKNDRRRYVFVPYVYYVEKKAVKNATILVSISNSDAEHYVQWTDRDKIIVIPQGFNDDMFHPFYEPVRNDPKIVLFCGNYNISTNRDVVRIVMDEIVDNVVQRCTNITFRFIGANPPRYIKHPHVEFTGFVDDYPAYLQQADVVISPMQQGWGFPTKIIEALACGKPTIATPVGVRSVERDYTSLYVCEIDKFPEMICKVLNNDKPVTTVDFTKLKMRYSWELTIQKLVESINKS